MSEQLRSECTCCVMDTSDGEISFDDAGVCNHCRGYEQQCKNTVHSGEEGERLLKEKIDIIKREGRGKNYDCIIGISAGVYSIILAISLSLTYILTRWN